MLKTRLARLAVAATLTASATFATAPAHAQSSGSANLSGSSGSSLVNNSDPIGQQIRAISEGLDVTLIGDIVGRAQTGQIGLVGADLGVMAPVGAGEEFAIVFGDSFTAERLGGTWMSPVGVVAQMGADGSITITRPLNDGAEVQQLIDYAHTDGLTLIPSDIINIDGTLYMQGMWNKGIGNVLSTEIFSSADYGMTWQSEGKTSTSYMKGKGNLISWDRGPDGYIYVTSSEFKRKDPVYLSRFRIEDIGDRTKWEIYDPTTGVWSNEGTAILRTNVSAGEMCLRYIQGHWVHVMFNAATMAIEVRISDEIARDWNEIAPAYVVVAGTGGWGSAQSPNNFTQLYGGYIVPGSTIDNMDLIVSHWNTSNNSTYTSTQFNVKGLDTFFGINLAGPDPAPTTNQADVDVTVTDSDTTVL